MRGAARAGARSAAVSVSTRLRICQRQADADQFPENNDSQEQTPGSAPENLASAGASPAESTPENMELPQSPPPPPALAAERAQAH
jgi:hypothetical protein